MNLWNWWPVLGVGALLWTQRAHAKVATTVARHAGKLAVFPVEGGKMPTGPKAQYGYQRTPTHKHHGVDLFAPKGTAVLAPFAGEVVHVNRKYQRQWGGFGRAVVLRVIFRGATFYVMFAHLASIGVDVGDKLEAGQQLGKVGLSKFTDADPTALFRSSNAHLHFELARKPYPMAKEAQRVDPTALLEAALASPFTF